MKLKARYEVEKLDGEYPAQVVRYEEHRIATGVKVLPDGREEDTFRIVTRRVMKTEMKPCGFMVYMAKGDILHVPTEAELIRLGLDSPAATVDMDSGEVVPTGGMSLKQAAIRRTKITPPERLAAPLPANEPAPVQKGGKST